MAIVIKKGRQYELRFNGLLIDSFLQLATAEHIAYYLNLTNRILINKKLNK